MPGQDHRARQWASAQLATRESRAPSDAASAKESRPFSLSLLKLSNVALPQAVRAAIDSGARPRVSHRLLVSLYDTQERRFFGRTWEGAEVGLDAPRDGMAIAHEADVFFHSSLIGRRCVIIVESAFVVAAGSASAVPTRSEYSGGWAVVHPFDTASQTLLDFSREDRGDEASSARAALHRGSPLAVLHLAPHEYASSLTQPASGQLAYALRTHTGLLPARHLLREHGFFSPDRPVGGLLPEQGAAAALYHPASGMQATLEFFLGDAYLEVPATLEEATRRLLGGAEASAPPGAGPAGRRAAAAAASVRILSRRLVAGTQALCGPRAGPGASEPLALQPLTEPSIARPPAAPGTACYRSATGAPARLGGVTPSPLHAIVLELQLEVEGGEVGAARRFVTLAWGCLVPLVSGRELGSSRQRIVLDRVGRAPLSDTLPLLARMGSSVPAASTVDFELRPPHDWGSHAREISETAADELLQHAFAALRPPAVSASDGAMGMAPEGTAEEEGHFSMQFAVDPSGVRGAPAAHAATPDAAVAEQPAAAQRRTKMELEDGEVAARKAFGFWSAGLQRAAFHGWALTTRLTRRARSLGAIELSVSTLQMLESVRMPALDTAVVEMHAPVTSRPIRSGPLPKNMSKHAVVSQAGGPFVERLEVLSGMRSEATLLRALEPGNASSSVRFYVRVRSSDNPAHSHIACEARVELRELLDSGADLVDHPLVLYDADGLQGAELIVAVRAVDALRKVTTAAPMATETSAGPHEAEVAGVGGQSVARPRPDAEVVMAAAAAVDERGEDAQIDGTLGRVDGTPSGGMMRAEKARAWHASQAKLEAAASDAALKESSLLVATEDWRPEAVRSQTPR
jgi:hypothetical protein